MQPTGTRSRHVRLASSKHLRLVSHLLQLPQYHAIAVGKTMDLVLNLRILTELLNKALQAAEVVSRYARKEMVYGLEL